MQSAIINFVPDQLDSGVVKELERLEIVPAATIPLDEEIHEYDLRQKSLLDLPDNSRAVMAAGDFIAKTL